MSSTMQYWHLHSYSRIKKGDNLNYLLDSQNLLLLFMIYLYLATIQNKTADQEKYVVLGHTIRPKTTNLLETCHKDTIKLFCETYFVDNQVRLCEEILISNLFNS